MKIGWKTLSSLLIKSILLILPILLILYLFLSGKINEAEISIPGGATVKLKGGNKKNLIENIEALFSNEKIASVVINYIGDHKKIYGVTDRRIIAALAQLCDQDDPIKFSHCLKENPLLLELRNRAFKRHPPFQYEAVSVDIGFAKPDSGYVIACKNGRFGQGALIEISSVDFSRKIERRVKGYYNCTRKPFPDIQLNTKDRMELFGDSWPEKRKKGYATLVESKGISHWR